MGLQELFAEKDRDLEREHKQALDAVRDPLRDLEKLARAELPKIEAAHAEADPWTKDNIEGKDWRAIPGGLPKDMEALVFQLKSTKGNPGEIRRALQELEALTSQQCWGNRPDGGRDVNRAANLMASIKSRLYLASGCAGSIRDNLKHLKAKLAALDADLEYRQSMGLMPAAEATPPAAIMVPAKNVERQPLSSNPRFDPRIQYGQ